ncbi:hypothetical protein B0A50_03507 [Salinomyces thailandicus]|uniref:F-box domain-containing protein n=1 Tax=Salinomyces thailandicus TaxID=706561 RepID=A0A4U0U3V8_9PEZI|nr:hypothetical protein B0A50_03507 [Salinomyces thailandica]
MSPDEAKVAGAIVLEPETHEGNSMTKNEANESKHEDDQVRPIQVEEAESGPRGTQSTTSPTPTSSPYSGGDNADFDALGIDQQGGRTFEPSTNLPPPGAKPDNLRKRRASVSPEKLNTGKFDPLPLRIDTSASTSSGPFAKRARIENCIEVSYDSLGTPRIASVTPTLALPSGKSIPTAQLRSSASGGEKTSYDDGFRFSIINAFLRNNDLLLNLVSYLTIPSLINLYAISKGFHYILNSNYMTFILSNVRTWAPSAPTIFPWRCYKPLCVHDPQLRKKSSMVGRHLTAQYQDLRDVPSLKWLQMVVWRQGVCKDMLIQLATKGLRSPTGTLDAVSRMWFILDLPLNSQRIALCRSQAYITNRTIYLSTAFFLKIDMALTDPSGPVFPVGNQYTNFNAFPRAMERCGTVGCDLRELLTSERNFTSLWRVLRGWTPDPTEPQLPMTRLDVLRLWVRHRYQLPAGASERAKRESIMGIPWHQVGTASLERTGTSSVTVKGKTTTAINPALTTEAFRRTQLGQQVLYPHAKHLLVPTVKPRETLMRPEELMMKESVRRQLEMHRQWAEMMLWGFTDDLGRNLPERSEEELLRWSRGHLPLELFRSNEEVERERAKQRKEQEESGQGSGSTGDKCNNG